MATITELKGQAILRGGARSKLERMKEEMGIRLKPRWGVLYALGLLGGVLLIAGEILFGSTVARGVWDVTAAGVTLGAIKLWVQANRSALAWEGRVDITAATPQGATDIRGTPTRTFDASQARRVRTRAEETPMLRHVKSFLVTGGPAILLFGLAVLLRFGRALEMLR